MKQSARANAHRVSWAEPVIRIAILMTVTALHTGCATQSLDPSEPPPANYRDIVARHVRENFFDPYSIRDASIAPPKPGELSRTDAIAVERGWIVCVRANAKNRMGGYIGLKTSANLVRGGIVQTSHSGEQHYEVRTNCAGAVYEPFREIDSSSQRPPQGRPS
jgi:hypothetical protein